MGIQLATTEPSDAELMQMFLVGTPGEVSDALVECAGHAERLGCEHIVLGVPTGPDPAVAIELACNVVIPDVLARTAPAGPAPATPTEATQ